MLKGVGGVCLFMLLLVGLVSAADQPAGTTPVVQPQEVEQANRYLSAEMSRQIKDSKEEMLKEMQDYQDANFLIFDQRMTDLMSDMKMKITIGAMGAVLFVNAIVAFLMMKKMRNYSFEKYQEDLIGKQQERIGELEQQKLQESMQWMQQPSWSPQQPNETVGMRFGQAQASQMTQMNAWQAQPAYDGAWKAPIVATPDYSYAQPMQSPQQPPPQQQSSQWYEDQNPR